MIYYFIILLLIYIFYLYVKRLNKKNNYNHNIERIFNKLKFYKKYNKKNYKLAKRDWNRFINMVDKLNNEENIFYNRDFETTLKFFNNKYVYDIICKSTIWETHLQ